MTPRLKKGPFWARGKDLIWEKGDFFVPPEVVCKWYARDDEMQCGPEEVTGFWVSNKGMERPDDDEDGKNLKVYFMEYDSMYRELSERLKGRLPDWEHDPRYVEICEYCRHEFSLMKVESNGWYIEICNDTPDDD
jgi:hypothetical protein